MIVQVPDSLTSTLPWHIPVAADSRSSWTHDSTSPLPLLLPWHIHVTAVSRSSWTHDSTSPLPLLIPWHIPVAAVSRSSWTRDSTSPLPLPIPWHVPVAAVSRTSWTCDSTRPLPLLIPWHIPVAAVSRSSWTRGSTSPRLELGPSHYRTVYIYDTIPEPLTDPVHMTVKQQQNYELKLDRIKKKRRRNYEYQGFSQEFEMPFLLNFHENGVSTSYLFTSKISNFRVSKIRIGCPKDGWTGLWLKHWWVHI